ncbi:hypothetical protein FZD47_12920 [Bacillus infantis]|uniref:Restriction endonuclease n=1 Tax=Bacillus infantis TaxID=324767 RepID=A0A5D4SNN8_9BACI|nr:hypothetical protein [Bacillus infantis]TYS64361.1 hypothetical protein FZD47_12920 [Bacillus infantis]
MTSKFNGFNALDLIFEQCNKEATEFQKILLLNEESKIKLAALIDKIDNGIFSTEKEKGDALELLTRETLKAFKFFDALPNIFTSTNEIDFLCKLSNSGNIAKAKGYIRFEDEFLIECKNYARPVDVTYVGKFACLLLSQSKNLGILVSKKGITGSNWSDAYGWTKKLYLKHDILIISFTLEDFRQLLDNKSFFEIIEQKKMDIINDTDINSYLQKHPSMLDPLQD